ncbi:MAG: DUF4421 family protein [Prevotella sp.]|nr:DUF4421 family protein [Prevotella sp.]
MSKQAYDFNKICFVVILLAMAMTCTAQTRHERVRAKLDSILSSRYFKTSYDTNYVVRPAEGKVTVKLRLNESGNSIHAKGTVNDVYSKADLSTRNKTTVAVAAIYRGLSVGLAINPDKIKGAYKDYEFNMNYYSSRVSFDLSYQRSSTLTGDIERNGGTFHMQEGNTTMKVFNLAGYYAFNHRKFSYSAAFTQSFIQRRSAGSWFAGFSYQGGSIKTTDDLKERNPNAPEVRLYIGHFGIGGGYGYNLVLGKKWLFHLSALPTFVVYNRNNFTINGDRKYAKHIKVNMLFNERAAIVYNFSPRFFAGATMTMNNSIFDDDAVTINQNKWRVRAFLGVRL